jgi:hypothetical protein
MVKARRDKAAVIAERRNGINLLITKGAVSSEWKMLAVQISLTVILYADIPHSQRPDLPTVAMTFSTNRDAACLIPTYIVAWDSLGNLLMRKKKKKILRERDRLAAMSAALRGGSGT